jgi:hypothetical protein
MYAEDQSRTAWLRARSGDIWTGSSSTTGASFVLKVVATDVDGRKSSDTQSVFVHSGGNC